MLTSDEGIHSSIGDIVYSRKEIETKVSKLAKEVVEDIGPYADVTVIGVSDGCMFLLPYFSAQMQTARGLTSADSMHICSVNAKTDDGLTCITGGPDAVGENVVILDVLCETGRTLKAVYDYVQDMNPAATIVTLALVQKICYESIFPVDYVGFEYEDQGFLIGYGMDYTNLFRALSDIRELVLIRDIHDGDGSSDLDQESSSEEMEMVEDQWTCRIS